MNSLHSYIHDFYNIDYISSKSWLISPTDELPSTKPNRQNFENHFCVFVLFVRHKNEFEE